LLILSAVPSGTFTAILKRSESPTNRVAEQIFEETLATEATKASTPTPATAAQQ
jgi:hypothetical protein